MRTSEGGNRKVFIFAVVSSTFDPSTNDLLGMGDISNVCRKCSVKLYVIGRHVSGGDLCFCDGLKEDVVRPSLCRLTEGL